MAELTRILHVDDDEDIRVIASLALEMVGSFELLQCASGQEALDQAVGFDPDLVLLDYMMPEMNGEETFVALRKTPGFEALPVIFMTARVQDDVARGLMAKGALGVIPKPFDPMTLADNVRQIWNGKSAAA